MDPTNPVPKTELLKRPMDSLTPQQQARALVMMNKHDAQAVYSRLMTTDVWEQIFQKVIERATNGHLKSAEFLTRINGMTGIKPGEEPRDNTPMVVVIDNAKMADTRELVDEPGGGGG